MKSLLLAAALTSVSVAACTTQPSAVNSFRADRVSPAPGSAIDLTTGATITISGPLSITENSYYTMVYVRDDGNVFLAGEWGPSSGSSSWDNHPFTQDASYDGHVTEEAFARFCSGRTVTRAAFVLSNTSIMTHTALNNPQYSNYNYANFNWNIVRYRVEVPLDYRCR